MDRIISKNSGPVLKTLKDMDSLLSLTAIQTHLFWEDKDQNRIHLDKQLAQLPATDIIVLPEMFTTGFTMEGQKFSETMEGPTFQWMKKWAEKTKAAIAGSCPIIEQGKCYNRFLFVAPSGEIQWYDKRHTFTLSGENEAYASGRNNGLINYHGWKICLRVCYDLRFPVWARNSADYDLLIFTANWPHKRIEAWDTLLKARSIENMAYCVGINRIGIDGSGLFYPGHTAIYDYMGQEKGKVPPDEEGYIRYQMNKEAMYLAREKLKFLNDRDTFTIQS